MSLEQCNVAIQRVLPEGKIPAGTSLSIFPRSIGGSIGIAIAQNVFEQKLRKNLAGLLPEVDFASVISACGATDLIPKVQQATGGDDGQVRRVLELYNNALSQTFLVALVLSAMTLIGACQMSDNSSSKRFRACDPCHSIKIKCELGSRGGEPPCARCVRLGKDCIITPPKRQKDRAAELEAQVESLSRLLQSQKLGATPTDSGERRSPDTYERTPVDSKKRRLENTDIREASAESEVDDMDHVLDPAIQRTIYHKYVNEIIPRFSLVPIPQPYDYDTLRRESPFSFKRSSMLIALVFCHLMHKMRLAKSYPLA